MREKNRIDRASAPYTRRRFFHYSESENRDRSLSDTDRFPVVAAMLRTWGSEFVFQEFVPYECLPARN